MALASLLFDEFGRARLGVGGLTAALSRRLLLLLFGLAVALGTAAPAAAQSLTNLEVSAFTPGTTAPDPWRIRTAGISHNNAADPPYLQAHTRSQTVTFTGIEWVQEESHWFCRDKSIARVNSPPRLQARSQCRHLGNTRSSLTVTLTAAEIANGGVVWHTASSGHSLPNQDSHQGSVIWIPIGPVETVALLPAFDGATTSYDAGVNAAANILLVTPTAASGAITVALGSGSATTVTSGSEHRIESVDSSSNNTLSVVVTEASQTRTYTVTLRPQPSAAITATNPSPLTAGNLNTATVTVTLSNATFASGVTASSFTLDTGLSGLSVNSVATVTAGDTAATLTLAKTGAAPTAQDSVAVTVAAAATDAPAAFGALKTASVPVLVPISIDADASTDSVLDSGPLVLRERSGAADNAKDYGVRLLSAPSASVTITVTSGDTGAVTVDTNTAAGLQSTLTFSTTNWGTWQTVTAQAVQDADGLNESVTVSHAPSGGGVTASNTLTVTVRDDEEAQVLLDANPTTTAVDDGPLLLNEASARSGNYAVSLSEAPSGAVTVALASDNPAVTLSASALTFTTTSWSTGQTVTATTTTDADAADEAAAVTHTGSGGGYDEVSATLKVGVSDAERTGTDYDADEDGLIEIDSLAKLNAIRWDLNGDGDPTASNASNYRTAFPSASTNMGCPDGPDFDQTPDTCIGYELTRDLDFDTNNSGSTWSLSGSPPTPTSDSGDAYHNGGSGWDPIGPATTPNNSTHFNAVFDGNGHSIDNLFINRTRAYTGLFAALRPDAVVRALGLRDVFVNGGWSSAPLAGQSWAWTAGVWATGTRVRAPGNLGGLVGVLRLGATVVASYSTVPVQCTNSSTSAWAGGLVGDNQSGATVAASYATGPITGPCPANRKSGLAAVSGTVTASYWDTTTSTIADDMDSSPPEGRTTVQLQAPTDYAGLYAAWRFQDVDGDGVTGESGDDDVWAFGTDRQYPVLKFGGFDTAVQFAAQPPSFGTEMAPQTAFNTGASGTLQIPAAAHAGAITYTATGLPDGLSFDVDGSGSCSAARTICGTPARAGSFLVTIRAANADGASTRLRFTLVVTGIEIDADPDTTSTVEAGPLALAEEAIDPAHSDTYAVRLSSAPNASVTVTATSGDTGAVTVDTDAAMGLQSTLTFTTTNWGTWQTVTAQAVQDADFADETVTITHAAGNSGGYNGLSASLTVTVDDDELAEVLLDIDPSTPAVVDRGPLLLDEASTRSDNYAVKLGGAPNAAVTVAVASDNPAVMASPAALTFTTTSWNTGQTVTATTTTDADAVDEAAAVTHRASGGDFEGAAATLNVGVADAQRTGTDYDTDEDGLIEIDSIAKLNAMRWDLDGSGLASAGNESNWAMAFPGASTRGGCPDSGDADQTADDCKGYELTSDLDFGSDDGGAGWDPIGPFEATFNGNGHVIRNLVIRRAIGNMGLFSQLNSSAHVTSVGLANVNLRNTLTITSIATGALAGRHRGRISASWASGTVFSGTGLGGLVGRAQSSAVIVASYSVANVDMSFFNGFNAGLVGRSDGGTSLRTSYAAGHVYGPSGTRAGLTGGTGTVVASYWDTGVTTVADDGDDNPPEGRTRLQLAAPTEYGATGLYASWDNQDVDGDGVAGESLDDDAWDFGTDRQLPVLKFGGFDTAVQFAIQPPSFGTATVPQTTFRTGVSGTLQIPAAAHPGAITYTATGLPPGMSFDGDGSGDCSAMRTICGEATRTGTFTVTIQAANADGVSTRLRFTIVVGGIEIDANPATSSAVAGPLALEESEFEAADSDTYRLRLTAAPNASVTVTVTSADTGAVTVDTAAAAGLQSTLTFTTTNWNAWQTVTAQAVQDTDVRDESVEVTHAASGGGYNNVSAPLTVTVNDDEVVEVLVDADPSTPSELDAGPLLLDETSAQSGNYAVKLSDAPTAVVTVALASDNPAVTLSVSSLTFTLSNWAMAQTVTATTTTDADAVDEAAAVTHTASGGGYDSVVNTLRVGVADAQRTGTDYDTDEDGLIEISSLAQLNAMRWDLDGNGVVTSGNTGNYTTAFPGASTGMGCPDGSDANQTADACTGYELTRDLDFDTDGDGGTWSGSPPTSDSDDAYHNGGNGWLSIGSRASSGTRFRTTFDGNGHVIRNLFISRSPRDQGLFAAIGRSAHIKGVGIANARLHNVGDSSGILVGNSEGRISACWTSGAVRGGSAVGGLVGGVFTGSVVVASYSTASVTVTKSNGGGAGLVGWNGGGETIRASYSTGAVTGGQTRRGLAGGSGYVKVSASYWDTTLSGINDDGDSDPPEGRSTSQLQAPRGYTGLYVAWNKNDVDGDGVAGGVADDVWDFGTASQHPVLKYARFDTALQFNSQGTDSAPDFGTSSVTNKTYPRDSAIAQFQVPAASGGNGALSYSASGLPAGLVFDADGSGTCGVPRAVCGTPSTAAAAVTVTVTVTDGDDNTQAGDRDTLTFTITVTTPPAVSSRSLSLNEAAGSNTDTFTMALASAPAATTTLTVTSADTGAVTVDPAALTFTTTDWSTAQTVTATAQQDDDAENESTTVTLWDGAVALARVSVTVADDDLGRVLVDADPSTDALDPGPIALGEPGDANYTVRLSAQPTANVVVSVSSADTGAVYLPSGHRSLTFTTGNWSTAQTKRVSGLADADALDEAVTVTFRAAGGGYNGTATRLRVTVTDDDRSGTDFDTDEDGLIEISTLAQLNAVRWDLDGDGSVSATDQTNYTAAFPSASAGMGCPSVSGTATCTGYELVADLDFDTDGDGVTHTNGAGDSGDATYYNSGAGFAPIGNRSAGLEAVFDGNGHVIYNLFVNRTTSGGSGRDTGLFGAVGSAGAVRNLGVADAWVSSASDAVGALVGRHYGRVEASWTSGSVTGNSGVGGLAGSTDGGSMIVAGYSTASVTVTGSAGGGGGLAGWTSGDVAASYATGAVTGGAAQHGLANGSGAVASSYWDTEASGVPTSTKGAGRTTMQLQGPTAATGIYAGWDRLDLDGDGDSSEAPWDFGTDSEYPVLRVGSNAEAGVFVQRGDYDLDDDGLIDVYSLAHLNAVRWDLDGDGAASSGNAGAYRKAFRHHRDDMGCPTTTIDADDNDCTGYELMNDLDFDTDGDDSTHTAGVSDSGDAYHNGGGGWDPIGPASTPTDADHFHATFDGGGHVVHNLFIDRQRAYVGLFAALRPTAVVRALGLRDAWVDAQDRFSAAPLAGQSGGRVAAVWTSGTVEGGGNTGGLVGVQLSGGTIVASYSTASVECTDNRSVVVSGGLVGDNQAGAEIVASYAAGAVTGACPTANKAGVANGGGAVAASYWDTNLTGVADDQDTNPPEGRSTVDLQTPTEYGSAGLYAAWDDQDVDGDGISGEAEEDDAWEFGLSNQHPVLKWGGFDTAVQFNQQPDLPPSFTAAAPSDVTVQNGRAITPIQIPAVGAGNGAVTVTVTGLPAGLSYDADGGGSCGAERTICGTPGTDGASTVTVTAADSDDNVQSTDQATLTFRITVATPSASISATSPAALTENNLNGATVTVALTNTTFGGGVTKSSFTLDTNVPGLDVDSVATVASGDASATLTLDYDGTDFDTARTLGVTVAASAHALAGSLTTATVGVAAGTGVRVAPPSLSLSEDPTAGGGTNANQGSYSVVLESQPAGSVTVTATSADAAVTLDADGTPLTFSLTFAATSWETAQTVTATAAQDDDAADESVQVTHAVTGYPGVTTATAVAVAVDDDETAAVLIDADPSTMGVDESGPVALSELSSAPNNTDAYTVRLSSPPTAAVTVTAASADAGAVTVDTSSASGLQSTLTFTSTNWATGQEVTLAAQQDADGVHESVVVTNTASTAAMSEYTNVSAAVTATVEDDEAPGFVFDSDTSTPAVDDAAPLNLDELAAGTNSDSYSVRLTSQPTQDVTVTITSPDTDAVTVGTSTLTFTTSNWRTAQTVAATAVQDLDGANESVDVSHAASTATNSEYTGVTGDFEVAVDDDETPAITLSPTSLNVNEQNSAAYTVALATQPTGAVTVAITGAGSGISANPTSLAFTSSNWATARTVSVSAVDDQNSANEQVTLRHTAAGAAEYGALTADLQATALDNDTPSLRVDPTALTVPEGMNRTYTVRLNTQPSATVTVTVSGAGSGVTVDTDGAVGDQNTLTFTAMTWETEQTVTVSAAADDNGVDEVVSLSHAAAGGDYGTITGAALPGVSVTADDDDAPAVLLDANPATATVDEAGPQALKELAIATDNSLNHTVRLATEPTADVTVAITSADTGAVTVGTSALTFTANNWDTGQTVALTAAQDADGVNESVVVTHAASTASMSEYTNVSATITATVEDDEAPGFVFDADPSTPATVDAEPLNLDELAGSTTNSDDYSVRLSSQPTQDVTVAVGSPDTGAVTVGASTLTFTTSNWRTAQTVTATAAQDLDGADESVEVAHAAGTAMTSEYTGITGAFEVAVDDDETPAITLSPTSLNVNEELSAAYTVALATQPKGGGVTVAVTGAGSGISANPTSLAFTSSNWATARTVTVRAADDQNSVNEQVTLTHTATGADYGTLTADLEVTALDNDTPSLRVDPTALTVPEADSRTYAVRLNTQPSATVTVTVSGAASGVTVDTDSAVGDQSTLTFTAMTWETEQTVTVSAAADDNGVDEAVSLSHAAAGGDYGSLTGAALPGVSVTADDDDAPAVLLDADPTTGNVDEAGPLALQELASGSNSDSYTVRLATEPTEAVTVTVTSSDAGSVAVGDTDGLNPGVQNTLTFTAMNWDTRRTVTVAAAQDDDGVDEEAVVTNAATTAGMSEYGGLSAAVTVTVDDDETPGFAFDAVPSTPGVDDAGPLNLDELPSSGTNSASYTVRLATEPKQTVTVTVASDDTGAVTVGTSTLTFTSANWNAPQAVALTAQQDDDGADEGVDIGHAAATTPNSEYTGVSADFRAAVDDDETPGITLSPASLTVGEQDSQTYTVVLDTEPAGGNGRATVTVTGVADGITASPTRLVFSASNWDTARTVRVRAADDQNSANEVVTLSHAGSGADYDGVSKDLEVTAQDNDTPSLRVRPTALTVREDGSATYRIRLNTEPSAAVTVTVGGTTAEVTVDADRDTTGDQTSLTFTDADWRAERTVAVSAAPDDDATDEMVNLTHAATGGDYTGLAIEARPGVSVTVDDDDEPAVLIDADPVTTNEDEPGPLALNELSGHPDNSKGYTVRLATEPTAQVEVVVTSGDRAVSVDADQTPLTRTLTFTTLNWSAAQTVTATAAEDPDASNERVEIAHAADGGDYGGVSARLFATTVDDDEPALVVDAAALTAAGVAEGGSAIYTVRLETEPAGVAVVSIAAAGGVSVDADGDQAGLQRSLRFDAVNWSVARTVTVRGLEDDDAAAGAATLRHTSSGADYGRAQAVDVAFAVVDDDTPAVVIDQTAVAVNEGASAAYLVMLATAPSGGAVTVSLSSSDAAAATVSPAVLRFTAGDWERPRRVTVRGEPDGDSADGSATVSHSVSGGDYGAVTASPVAVAVRDSEAAGVRVEPPRLTVREGGTGRYRVRLNTEPAGDVTVTATGVAELAVDSDETPQERALTFTTGNWGAERTVTVEAARDDGAEDGSLTVTHAVSGYAGVATAPALQVRVEDGDEPGFTFDPEGGLSLSEEPADPADAMGAYTVRLATQPSGAVAVEVSSDDAGVEVDTEGTPRTLSLSFDASNWATGQSVSVRAVADADQVGETASLLHTAAGGGYGGVSGTLRVRVADDDRPPAPPPPPPPPPENRPPVVVGSLADLDLDVGESASVRLGGVFADDGPLSHWAESSDGSVASARVEGNSMLRVSGLSPGAAVVTVWAADVEGQRAQLSFRVSVGRVLSFDPASASAPEGGTLRLRLSLSRPAGAPLSVSWTALPDGDAATADADATDVSALSGTAEFAAGRTEAFIDLEVRDDAEIEPAREVLRVELSPPPEGANWALGRSWALLWIEEGVCDRSPVVRDALRGSRECSAPTSSDLSGRGYLGLHRLDLPALRPKDFLGLSGLRVLHLHGNLLPELPAGLFEGLASLQRLRLDGNRLPSLPEGLFAGLGRLSSLRLDNNRLESLPANLLSGASNLERLDLGGNLLESLPPRLFAGAANLDELNLAGNPGAPFALVMRLTRTDAEPWAPGPAWVSAQVAEGAPFAFTAALLAENAEPSAESTSVPAGATSSAPMSVAQEGPGAARLSLSDGPALPATLCGDVQDGRRPCFRGLSVQAGPALLLFKPPPSPTGEPPTPALSADGDRASISLDGLFSPADAGDRLTYAAESDRPDLLSARIVDGGLVLEANEDGDEGTAVVTVTAMDPDGPSATLSLTVQVEYAPVGAAPSWRLEWIRTLRDAEQ